MARTPKIRTYGDAGLRKKNETITEFGPELERLFERMREAMIEARGVGLAGPQIGVAKMVAVVNPDPDDNTKLIRMANPRIVVSSDETDRLEEGCLSVPGIRGEVPRASKVTVVYQDEKGREHTIVAEGFLARVIQHELDHLNGVLFVDRLSLAKRSLIKSKLKELAEGEKER
jgi:peptide deformylase